MEATKIQSKSAENRKKLEALSIELQDICGLRYMIDPQKEVSAEGVIEDVISHLEDIKSGRAGSQLITTIR